jgi:hypothetical protein
VKARLLGVTLVLCGALGCAAVQFVGVETDPPGAQIYLDGKLVGTTPAKLKVSREKDHMIYLKRDGYRPEPVVLEKHEANDGIDYLTPADVVKRLSPGQASDPELERKLRIEIDKKN